MFIDQQAAQKIVNRTMSIIGHNVNVMNHRGVIVGSGDQERIGQLHEGALNVLHSHVSADFDEQSARLLLGVQNGINLPIVCNGDVIGVVGITGSPKHVKKYANLVVMTAELIIEQAVLTSQVQWDKTHNEAVICRLIQGGLERDSLFDDRVERLGINVHIPRVAVIVEVHASDGKGELPLATLQNVLRLMGQDDSDNLSAIISTTQVVMLKRVALQNNVLDEDSIKRKLHELCRLLNKKEEVSFKVSHGQYFPAIEGFSQSFKSALKTLEVGKLSLPHESLYCPKELVLDILVKEMMPSWNGDQLMNEYQKLVNEDKSGTLCKTIKVYFDQNTDFGSTAKALHIHRNTLRYRLDKIETILATELRNINNLVRFYLAFKLERLNGEKDKLI